MIKGLAGYAKAVYGQEHNGVLSDAVTKALGGASGATGGFFVPIEFKPQLLKLVIESQVVRPRATIFPMATDTMWIPRIVDTTHVSGIHGGVAGTWTKEAGTITENDPTAGQIQLIAKKFSDYVLVSNELIQDSAIAIPALLSFSMREGLGFFEDVSAISGAGAAQMQGFLKSGSLVSVTPKVAGHVNYADVVSMYSRMFPSSHDNSVWVCSPDAWPDIAQMALAVGTGGSAVWITNYTTAVGAPPATIFGRPLIISEKMPALGSASCLCYCDFSYYVIGDRMQMALTSSEHVAFASDQTAFRIIERLDGQTWINSALIPNNASANTLSAFVSLAAS
jgi:HK97 family phage major capsid protein